MKLEKEIIKDHISKIRKCLKNTKARVVSWDGRLVTMTTSKRSCPIKKIAKNNFNQLKRKITSKENTEFLEKVRARHTSNIAWLKHRIQNLCQLFWSSTTDRDTLSQDELQNDNKLDNEIVEFSNSPSLNNVHSHLCFREESPSDQEEVQNDNKFDNDIDGFSHSPSLDNVHSHLCFREESASDQEEVQNDNKFDNEIVEFSNSLSLNNVHSHLCFREESPSDQEEVEAGVDTLNRGEHQRNVFSDSPLLEMASSSGFSREGAKCQRIGPIQTVGDVQGTLELRTTISRNALKNPDILSYSNRQKLKYSNPKLYRIIRNKLIGHIFNIGGRFPVDGTEYLFEGFSEDIVIPCLWSYLKRYFQSELSCGFSEQDKKWILDQYQMTLSHHRMGDTNFSDAANKIRDPDPENPVLILGGYDWHGVAYAFINNVRLYWNGHNHFMQIDNLEEGIDENTIKDLIQRHNISWPLFNTLMQTLFSREATPSDFYKMRQKTGNCIYKASNGLIQILLGLRHSLNSSGDNLGKSDVLDGLNQTKPEFKKFVKYLKTETAEELIQDYNEIKNQQASSKDRATIKQILGVILDYDIIKTPILTEQTRSRILDILS
jgi:hypothetical protein